MSEISESRYEQPKLDKTRFFEGISGTAAHTHTHTYKSVSSQKTRGFTHTHQRNTV